MNEYSFYQDVKVEIWQRQYFTIKADSKEEATGRCLGTNVLKL